MPTQQSSSEGIAGNIDLLWEILIRLPPKPLGQFKSVSKQWLALISDPKFCHSHTLRHHSPHPLPSALLLNNRFAPYPHFQLLSFPNSHAHSSILQVPPLDYFKVPRVSIIQSSNGLLLCSSGYLMRLDEDLWQTFSFRGKELRISFTPVPCVDYCDSVVTEDDRGFRYFVCNPTTTQFATVTFPNQQFRMKVITLNLAFDPFTSPHYKVISIRRNDLKGRMRFVLNVYSSETGSWSDRDVCFTPPPHMAHGAPVYFNGAIHWYCKGKFSLYFYVDDLCLKTWPMPPGIKYSTVEYFGEFGGHCHMVLLKSPENLKFNIFKLKEDYSGWTVSYCVDLTPMKVAFPELICDWEGEVQPFSVLGVFQHAKEENSEVVLLVDGRVISFNLVEHASRKLFDLDLSFETTCAALDYEGRDAYLYFENLTFVKAFPAEQRLMAETKTTSSN